MLTGTENRNANLGGADVLALYAAEGGRRNGLLNFELPALPSTDITSASLELTQLDGEWDNDPIQLSLFAVSSAWFEGTGDNPWASSGSGATWNRADSGNNWTTPGGDLNTSYDFGNGENGLIVSRVVQGYDAENTLLSLDVTSGVRAWLDGILPNYGLALVITQGNYSEYLFASSEYFDDSLKPALVIRF